jgi:hypothetical protein
MKMQLQLCKCSYENAIAIMQMQVCKCSYENAIAFMQVQVCKYRKANAVLQVWLYKGSYAMVIV